MLILTLFIFTTARFTPLILKTSRLTLHHFKLFILTPHRLKINPIHYRFALSGEASPAA